MDWNALIDQMAAGSIPALSRFITRVENREPGWRGAMRRLYPTAGRAAVIGITGYPGSGKSTLAGQLVREWVARGKRVGVIAVDPSSRASGGAFLGDRVRMAAVGAMEGVYIRSMGTRGAVGGLQQAARDVIRILDVFGKDAILIETVGVGQDEIDIARVAQLVLLVCAPGQGDAIQYLKAGVMEIADIYVANKADLPGAAQMVTHLRAAVSGAAAGEPAPIVDTSAVTGAGIALLADEIEKRIGDGAPRSARGQERMIAELTGLLREKVSALITERWVRDAAPAGALDALAAGRTDPYSLADDILENAFPGIAKKQDW